MTLWMARQQHRIGALFRLLISHQYGATCSWVSVVMDGVSSGQAAKEDKGEERNRNFLIQPATSLVPKNTFAARNVFICWLEFLEILYRQRWYPGKVSVTIIAFK